jgi:hypothetical protein
MLPIQAKPVSRSAQPEAAKVAPQVGASQVQCQLCCDACNLVPDPTARAWCEEACDRIPGCTCS